MIHTVDGINMHYIRYGNKKGQTLVFLHGWGQNIEMMNQRHIASYHQVSYDEPEM